MQSFINFPPQEQIPPFVLPPHDKPEHFSEKSLHRCSPTMVLLQDAPLAKYICSSIMHQYKEDISRAEKEGLSAIVDTSIQKLLPGQYPETPGWHCDGVPRHPYDGRPSFGAISPAAFSVMVSLSSEPMGVSNTEFVMDAVKPKIWDEDNIFRDLNEQVCRIAPRVATFPDGTFIKYTPKTIHRAVATHRRGWRFWMRFSMCIKPPITNTVGNPQQIYVLL